MDTSINNKKHGSTFISSSSNCDGEALGDYLETKYSGDVPLTLEPATIRFPEPLTHPECSDTKSESKSLLYQDDQSTLGKGKPSAVVEKSISPKVNKLLSDDQLSIKKACIIHLDKQFDLVLYSSSAPVEKCLVIKDAEIAPGLRAKRLEPHNPIDSDGTNLDVTVRAADTEQRVTAPLLRERKTFASNENKTGYIIFTSDLVKFSGSFCYRLPSKIAQAGRIGKSGHVFTMFHFREEYAVKKTVYRSNEISIHSQLSHPNIINLEAVLIGEKHKGDEDKLDVYHFMPKMELSFADVLSTREGGCLKYMKVQLIDRREQWELVLLNVRHILKSVLEALKYMHSRNFVHCKIKASNILIQRRCRCDDILFCTCHQQQKPVVKLGDFSSSSDVTGYEQMRITAVDIWSFGCLLLDIFTGEHGPLVTQRQVDEQLMEVQVYYADDHRLCDLIEKCLQIYLYYRPSAKELLTLYFFTRPLYTLPTAYFGPYTYCNYYTDYYTALFH